MVRPTCDHSCVGGRLLYLVSGELDVARVVQTDSEGVVLDERFIEGGMQLHVPALRNLGRKIHWTNWSELVD